MATMVETSPAMGPAPGPRKRPSSPSPFRAVSPLPESEAQRYLVKEKSDRKRGKQRGKQHSRTSKTAAGQARTRRRSSSDSLLAASVFGLEPDGSEAPTQPAPPLSPRTGAVRLGPAVPPAPPQQTLGKSLFQDLERTLQDIGKLLKRTVPASLRTDGEEDEENNRSDADGYAETENSEQDARQNQEGIGADLSAEQHDAAIVPRNTKRVKFSEGGQPGEDLVRNELIEGFRQLDLNIARSESPTAESAEIRVAAGDDADENLPEIDPSLLNRRGSFGSQSVSSIDAASGHSSAEDEAAGNAACGRRVRFHADELSVVLPFHAAAPPVALYDSGVLCMAFPDPGDRYFELEREREREREEEERKYVHGVVVHGWTPYPSYLADELATCRVEDVRLRARTTVGVTVVVRNLAFNKRVVVRYTMDRWHTFHEVEAKFASKLNFNDDSWDRFLAEIDVPSEIFRRDPTLPQTAVPETDENDEDPVRGTAGGRMHFAIKFICPGAGEWWDNNRGRNFEVEFRRRRRQGGWEESGAALRSIRRKDARRSERTKRKQEEWERYFVTGNTAPGSAMMNAGRQRP